MFLKSMNELTDALIEPLKVKFGRIQVQILLHWPEIAGEEISFFTEPYKVDIINQHKVLYLIIKNPSYILNIQHRTNEILDKVSSFFGYKAIDHIRITQNKNKKSIHQ